jgi:hypothetical protein
MRIQATQLGVQSYPPFSVHLRAPGVSGLGDDDPQCAPYDIVGQLNTIYQSYANNISVGFEQGTATDPATFAASLQQQAQTFCSGSSWGCAVARCTVPTDLINQLIAQYTQLYNSTMATTAAQIAAGDICASSLALFPGIQLTQRAITGCGYPGYSAAAASPVSGGGASSSSGGQESVSVQITNASRPGQTFQVGDSFTVVVIGPPNSPVAVTGTQNGTSTGTTPFGSTDGSGRFTVGGSMTPDTVGSWSEVWTVGGIAAPTVTFSVAAAPGAAATPSSSSPSPTSSATTPSSSTSLTTPNSTASTTNSNTTNPIAPQSWLMSDSLIGSDGFQVPNWMVIAAVGGLALLWMFSRGKR